jgi:hypothetical protein
MYENEKMTWLQTWQAEKSPLAKFLGWPEKLGQEIGLVEISNWNKLYLFDNSFLKLFNYLFHYTNTYLK